MGRQIAQILASSGQNPTPENTIEIPVYFTLVRNSDGSGASYTNSDVDNQLDKLNSALSGTNLHFYRLGDLNYLDSDLLNQDFFALHVEETYSYVTTAFNVYLRPGPSIAPFPGVNPPSSLWKDNVSRIDPGAFGSNSNTYVHETGHNLGLLHTFGSVNPYKYPDVLTDPGQIDHPYNFGFGKPRELVIRDMTSGKNFPNPNCDEAGDFLCDTEADAAPPQNASLARSFPAFDPVNIANCNAFLPSCLSGVSYDTNCDFDGEYRDYNEDPIIGEPFNYMGYSPFFVDCEPKHFSNQQKTVMSGIFQSSWTGKILDLPINVSDKVEYKGTAQPVKSVVLRWRHPGVPRYTNCISGPDGGFKGVLYSTDVTAEVRKIGSVSKYAGTFPGPGNAPAPYYVDDYDIDDWRIGVCVKDLICIRDHILSVTPFTNGYDMLAADASGNGQVNSFDMHLLRKLILGLITKLDAHSTPWLFVPEYIPQDNAAAFNTFPFTMNLHGGQHSYFDYTSSSWQYQIPGGSLDKSGYDAIKIGDVCDTTPFDWAGCDPNELSYPPSGLFEADVLYEVSVKADGFTNIEGFQTGFFIDHTQLEVLEVSSGNLSEFDPEENVGLESLEHDQFNALWFKSTSQSETLTGSNNTLFKLKVKALQTSDLSKVITTDPEKAKLPTMFFSTDSVGCMGGVDLYLEFEPLQGARGGKVRRRDDSPVSQETMLYCYPNPARERASVAFGASFDGVATLSLFDVHGKLMFAQKLEVRSGDNRVDLPAERFGLLPPGVYQVALQTGEGVITGRLVKI